MSRGADIDPIDAQFCGVDCDNDCEHRRREAMRRGDLYEKLCELATEYGRANFEAMARTLIDDLSSGELGGEPQCCGQPMILMCPKCTAFG